MTEVTSIEVSLENANKLRGICKNLEQILNKKHVSLDQALSVILSIKHTEEAISDMVLADTPTWRRTKKKSDHDLYLDTVPDNVGEDERRR